MGPGNEATLCVCAEIFHIMNMNVPASVGAPTTLEQSTDLNGYKAENYFE